MVKLGETIGNTKCIGYIMASSHNEAVKRARKKFKKYVVEHVHRDNPISIIKGEYVDNIGYQKWAIFARKRKR